MSEPTPPPAQPQIVYIERKKRHILRNLIFGFVAIVIVATAVSAVSGNGKTASDGTSAGTGQQDQEADHAATTASIGDKVRDGKFQFTVTKVRAGVKTVGPDMAEQKAQGQFVLVTVTVKNIGDKAQTLDGSSQYLYVGDKRYSADTEAAIYMDSSNTFLEQVNPGNSLKGVVIFDIPKGAKPDRLELHDSPFSGGVDVTL